MADDRIERVWYASVVKAVWIIIGVTVAWFILRSAVLRPSARG
jgi:hypothetical protein